MILPRKRDHAVFLPLPVADDNLRITKVDIHDSQANTFHQTHAAPVHESRHQTERRFGNGIEQAPHFTASQHGGKLPRLLCGDEPCNGPHLMPENLFMKEHERIECLMLSAGRHLEIQRKVIEIRGNVLRA